MSGFDGAFEQNPKIAGGDLVLRVTRVPLRSVLASLAEGCSVDEILQAFPTLTREQLRDAVAFATSSALSSLPLRDRAGLDRTDEIGDVEGEQPKAAALDELTQEAQKLRLGY